VRACLLSAWSHVDVDAPGLMADHEAEIFDQAFLKLDFLLSPAGDILNTLK
jgi:hypothetical protein